MNRLPGSSTAILAALALSACMTPPTTNVTPRAPTEVAASFGRTWDAVIDAFADRNIPIATMERASGFIATQALTVGREGAAWADCGTIVGAQLPPDRATYNVRVLGDSAHATARVTVRWTQGGTPADPRLIECATKGAWETTFETAIKERAEAAQ